ncbi:hypothetical protein [Calycomorphotria hydatis]|uniref:Uncharacterized protein n=1 Tax=Calycomorphotria hydatis TaxID=2528027 RepID=A0A517TEB6_9PLAN|nr:hypothetical protein [Calycomorphotria hydatis]QDT66718.1 hypothetical protein V22_39890 [Calycomorphotria hydatis]
MPITITLEDRQWATILGALQFWGEENAPGGDSTTGPYLETVGMEEFSSLSVREVEELIGQIQKVLE